MCKPRVLYVCIGLKDLMHYSEAYVRSNNNYNADVIFQRTLCIYFLIPMWQVPSQWSKFPLSRQVFDLSLK